MDQSIIFTNPPENLRLDLDDAHVWWLDIDALAPWMTGLLSPDEASRAGRFHFARDRVRYVAGRAWLRKLLGGYLDKPPADLEFEYSLHGKPALKIPGPALQFNLSNSEGHALAAFSLGRAVGVDLEAMRPWPGDGEVARRFFCAPEIEYLFSQTGGERTQAFFELWTAKEALLKALGDGLTRPINEVEVALKDGGARLVSIPDGSADDWQLRLLRPAPGWQAALALQGGTCQVRHFRARGDSIMI